MISGMAAIASSRRRRIGFVLIVIGTLSLLVGALGLAFDWGSSESTARARGGGSVKAETPAEFLDALSAATRNHDVEFRIDRLNPAVLARYGEAACRALLAQSTDPTRSESVTRVGKPEPYLYASDGLSTTVPGTITVEVVEVQNGVTASDTLHITRVGQHFTWFVDCGTPLPTAT